MSLSSKSNRNAKKFRVVFLGDQSVGKTSIIERYSSDRFDQNYNSTVGIDFNVKDVIKNGNLYRLQMWDTAGQQRYRSLIPTYLKNAHCVVFVFDVSNTKSLSSLSDWLKIFKEYQEAPGVVVGNKIDLTAARKIERLQGQKFSKDNNLQYIEVSAMHNKKIPELFDLVLEMIIQFQKQETMELVEDETKKNMLEVNAVSFAKNQKVELKKETLTGRLTQKCCVDS